MPNVAQFAKIAPYLTNPIVLIGFCLFLLFGIHWTVVKAKLSRLSQRQSSTLLRGLLKYEFWLAISVTGLGFAHVFHNARTQVGRTPITQQNGPCSANTVGNNNQTSVDCKDNNAGTRQK